MSTNPASWIAGWARRSPTQAAIEYQAARYSYADVDRQAGQLAGAMAASHGVTAGDRIAYLGLNSPEYVVLILACARLGAIMVPLNWRLAPAEIGHMLADSAPAMLFHEAEFAELAASFAGPRIVCGGDERRLGYAWLDVSSTIAPALHDDPSASLLLIYTSGTTGRPKGALLSHGNLLWNAINSTHAHDLHSGDRVLTNLPMFHAGGLTLQSLPALHAGATLIIRRRFTPDDTFAAMEESRPTLYLSVPSALQQMVDHARFVAADLSSLRMIMTGSAPVPEVLIRTFLARGIALGQIYGCTESTGVTVYTRRDEVVEAVGFAGRPAIHVDVQVVDLDGQPVSAGEPGEIAVRGPTVFNGYWGQPEASAECRRGDWLLTGDIGRFDARGFLRIEDRRKDMIISGGYNVYPAEIEAVLAECPLLAEAAVVGRPDPKWGEVPVVFAVAREGGHDASAVAAFLAGRLAKYKQPAAIRFVQALPRNATGKVQKYRLRDAARDSGDADAVEGP